MAAHKGQLADIAVRYGYSAAADADRFAFPAGLAVRAFHGGPGSAARSWCGPTAPSGSPMKSKLSADLAVRVINHLHREPDLQLVIFGRKDFDGDTAMRVVRPVQWQFDTSIRSFGHPTVQMDTAQRITMPAGLLADARQIIFAVLIDQDHEIQT